MITTERTDIANLWGDPYLELVKHWDKVDGERRERLEKRYPETREITDTIDEARGEMDLSRYLDTPAERFMNEVAIPVITIGSIFTPAAPVTAVTSVARTAVIVGPKLVRVATALGATEVYRELTTFFNKKAGEDAPKQRGGTEGYKSGKNWDSLNPVNTPESDRQIGKINKQAFGGGQVRTDGEYVFRFDPAHKTGKIHMERYRKVRNNVWQGYGEIDPVTGAEIEGSIARTEERIITW